MAPRLELRDRFWRPFLRRMFADEIANFWIYSLAKFAATENPVMTDPLCEQVFAPCCRNTCAQCMRRFGLAVAGYVIQLTFDREQRRLAG